MEQTSFEKAKEWGLLAFGFFGGFIPYGLFFIASLFKKNTNVSMAVLFLLAVSFILFLFFAFKAFKLIQSQTKAPIHSKFKKIVLTLLVCFIVFIAFIIANVDVLTSKDMIKLKEFEENLIFLVLILLIPIIYCLVSFLQINYILHKISGEKLFLIYIYYQVGCFLLGVILGLLGVEKIPQHLELITGFLSTCILYAAWKSAKKFDEYLDIKKEQ